MSGFAFRYRLNGAKPTVGRFAVSGRQAISAGDFLNFEDGEVDVARTGDGGLLGVAIETVAATDGAAYIHAVVDGDAVYGVSDGNSRRAGDLLDLAGLTGAQHLADRLNGEFVVVVDCSASEETLVRIQAGKHRETGPARGDSHLGTAISRAVAQIHSRSLGRGPQSVETFIREGVVVVLLHDSMTQAERSLAGEGRCEAARQIGRQLQSVLRQPLVEAVQELTGRTVVAFMSDHHIDPDLAVEVFVLENALDEIGNNSEPV